MLIIRLVDGALLGKDINDILKRAESMLELVDTADPEEEAPVDIQYLRECISCKATL